MKLYLDIFSEEEIISDSYKMEEVFDGAAVEVKSRMIVKGEENVDIGCGNAFGGKNEDEEEQGGAGNDEQEKVIDLVDAFNYEVTSFDKPGYVAYFKGYMKRVLEYLTKNQPNRVDAFKKGGRELFTWICDNFSEFTFYCPKSFDLDNLIILSYYKGEDLAPTFIYVMDGLKSIKV